MAGKRRKRGSGAVRLLPSGKWQARVLVGDQLVSAPHTFTAKVDATAWLDAASRDIAMGVFEMPSKGITPPQPLTVRVYADRWLAERTVKPRTRQEYRGLLDRHILNRLGGTRLDRVTPQLVRSWHAECAPDHPATRVKAYSLLRTIMETAFQDELIPTQPCRIRGAGTPPKPHQAPIPTNAEIVKLYEAMPEHLRATVLLGSWSSLRLGEVLGLKSEDLDLPRIHVRRSAVAVKGGAVLGSPKSAAGTRVVTVPPSMVPLLEPLAGKRGLLFPSVTNPDRPLATSQFYKSWDAAKKEAGVPDLRFHELRHFGATRAAQAGATIAELMARLGHTSPGAAMRYQRAMRDEELAARMDAV